MGVYEIIGKGRLCHQSESWAGHYPGGDYPSYSAWRKAVGEKRRQEHLLKKSLKVILEAIPKLKNIQKKVFYMQRYTGKSLVQIAEELEYDYDYIRHVASKANQVMKRQIK